MNDTQKFLRRVKGGAFRVAWSEEDLLRLGALYNLSEAQVAKALGGVDLSEFAPQPREKTPPASIKAADSLPLRWNYIASDQSKPDRVHDIVHVAGIDLSEFRKSPTWHAQHDWRRPIGSSITTEKVNGKLQGIMELAPQIYPDAVPLQDALSKGHMRGVSIGFTPTKWTYNAKRDGVDFHEIMLTEISAVSLPCCPGAFLFGPIKSLSAQAAEYRRQAEADMALVAKAKREADLEERMASTTPAQRKREREAALLQIRGRQ
jgi:HK97 family phage prohead protease